MKFTIITHVVHIKEEDKYFGYFPYVREMNIWLKYIDELIIVAPLSEKKSLTEIDGSYEFKNINFKKIPNFNFTNLSNALSSLFKLPLIFWRIFWAMKESDHIHLRCPGNVALIGCLIQIFFPNKTKTAKYAGNWDPKSRQPLTYRLQKWILNNTFLTHNMQVLIYGEWENSSENIKSFFTASYSESEKLPIKILDLKETIKFVFIGTLSSGKNPMYAIQLVENLLEKGYNVSLNLYGEGEERKALQNYIIFKGLEKSIALNGNQNQKVIIDACHNSHFVILASKSEGWPKALAEGMFWGCIPVATKISSVPFMLGYGKRGVLLENQLQYDSKQLESLINNINRFNAMRKEASDWSRKYTLDNFESEIKKMIQNL